jgi:hypothetical protein
MAISKVPEGVQPQVKKICNEVVTKNPGKVRNVWGYATTEDHNNRRCVDYMIYDRAGGDQIAQYHLNSKKRLLVDLIIWNGRIIRSYDKPGIKAWTWAKYTGKDPHTDHPHVQYKEGAYVPPQGGLPKPENPVKVGDMAIVLASPSLNGRAEPKADAKIEQSRTYGDTFLVEAVKDGWAQEAGNLGSWYSMQYLFPMTKPHPKNAAGIKKGDRVRVTADGGLRARILPGGPLATDNAGKPIVRPTNYQFTVTADPKSAWITGGTNWYSSDYLAKVASESKPPAPTPAPKAKPMWSDKPTVILPMKDVPGTVNYLQAVVRIAAQTLADGKKLTQSWVMSQDPDKKGDTRFLLYSSTGKYQGFMTVKGGGHGSSFHAYRSAAGNLYIWTLIGDTAYRIKWQPGKTITAKSSGVQKMAYGHARPVGTYEHYVGFRSANSTKETLSLHDRYGFTDPDNNSQAPIKKVTLPKREGDIHQSWAVSDTRIYRINGETNHNPPNGKRLHTLDVFDWKGKLLLDRFDITKMSIPTESDEPEGVTFTGTPGLLMAGKREGSTNKTKRSYPIWTITGLP